MSGATRPDLTLSYGAHPDQVADVWLPADPRPARLVLLWHGGFWRSRHDRSHVAPFAAELARRGRAVASLEYRRTGSGGNWRDTFVDVAAAADAVPGLLAAARPGRVNVHRVVYTGHSAGGQIALWAAVRHLLPPHALGWRSSPPPIERVVALAPVTDLAAAFEADLGEGAVAELVGGGPGEFPGRYAGINPAQLPAPEVPTWIVHGEADVRVPVAMSREYARTHLASRGQPWGLDTIPHADHFAVVAPTGLAGETAADRIVE